MHLYHPPTRRSHRMQLADSRFQAHNVSANFEAPENIMEYFSLNAPPNTRVCRKPPFEDITTAPMILTRLAHSFILAEVTVSADYEMDWDQGGLIIFTGEAPPTSPPVLRRPYVYVHRDGPRDVQQQQQQQRNKWVKVGLEFTGGELGVSTVVANPNCGADWSFNPAFPSLSPREAFTMAMPSLRVKLERVGSDLWVWWRVPDDLPMEWTSRSPEALSRSWKKCREVTGFFDNATVKNGVWVGCYASRPMDLEDPTVDDGFYVEFEDFEIL